MRLATGPARRRLSVLRVGTVGAALAFAGSFAAAAPDPAVLCETAARSAAAETGVPLNVLLAVAIAETGRTRAGAVRPWPWTVNFAGEGHWLGSAAEAVALVLAHQAAGAQNFDIGCFQINHRWHGAAFASVGMMFDPEENARYAARFLHRLAAEKGNWPDAAAAYHSRDPLHADRYRDRFETLLAELEQRTAPTPDTVANVVVQANHFPLLQAGGTGTLGSLMPDRGAGLRLIGVIE